MPAGFYIYSLDFLGIYTIGQGGVVKGNEITQTIHRGIRLDNGKQGIVSITDNTLYDMWGICIELNMQNSNVSNNTLYDIKGRAITGQNSKELYGNSIKYAWAVSDTSEGNNRLPIMLLIGISVLAVFLLVLFKKVIRHIIRS